MFSRPRIRNASENRRFSFQIADAVSGARAGRALSRRDRWRLQRPARMPRRCAARGARGFVHIAGHSDYFHPGNYDTSKRLVSVAGMDLALARGVGEEGLDSAPEQLALGLE